MRPARRSSGSWRRRRARSWSCHPSGGCRGTGSGARHVREAAGDLEPRHHALAAHVSGDEEDAGVGRTAATCRSSASRTVRSVGSQPPSFASRRTSGSPACCGPITRTTVSAKARASAPAKVRSPHSAALGHRSTPIARMRSRPVASSGGPQPIATASRAISAIHEPTRQASDAPTPIEAPRHVVATPAQALDALEIAEPSERRRRDPSDHRLLGR